MIKFVVRDVASRSYRRLRGRIRLRAWSAVLCALVLPLVVGFAWIMVLRLDLVSEALLPSPSTVAQTAVALLQDGTLVGDIRVSVCRAVIGVALGIVAGVVLGAAFGLSPRIERLFFPSFVFLAQIPTLAWLPFLMLLLGLGEALKIAVIARAVLVPVVMATRTGLRDVPAAYLELADVLCLPRWVRLRRIMVGYAIPFVLSGSRQGVSVAWVSLVVVEMIASTSGLGYLVNWGRTIFQLDVVLVAIMAIGVIGFGSDALLSMWESHVLRKRGNARA